MNQHNFYILELFSKFKPVLKQSFLLHCPTEIIKLFCNCLFDVVHGQNKMSADVSAKELKRHETSIAIICKKNSGITKKRQLLASGRGFKLLKLIDFFVLNHLKKRLEIKQEHERICVDHVGRIQVPNFFQKSI